MCAIGVDGNEMEENVVTDRGADAPASAHWMVVTARALRHRSRDLIRTAAIGVAVSLLVAFLIPPSYESTVRLMPPEDDSSSLATQLASMAMKSGEGIGSIAGGLMGMRNSSGLFVGVLKSRTVQGTIVDELDLRSAYGVRFLNRRVSREGAIQRLNKRTTITPDRKTGIMTITVSDSDPIRAQKIAESYVRQLDGLVRKLSTSAATRQREFLDERLVTVQQELQSAASDLSKFASSNATLDPREQGRLMVQTVSMMRVQLAQAEAALGNLTTTYTENSVRVRAARAQVAELKRQIANLEGSDGVRPTAGDGSGMPPLRQLPRLGVTYGDLLRRVTALEKVYALLTQEHEIARLEEAKQIPIVRVLDPADVPERRSAPSRTLIFVCGILLSILASSALIIGQEFWRGLGQSHPTRIAAAEFFEALRPRPSVYVSFNSGSLRRAGQQEDRSE